jgi:hypothetical protein
MSSTAVCSAIGCNFHVNLLIERGLPVATPQSCPKCGAATISVCPICAAALFGNPDPEHPMCAVCRADVRAMFARRHPAVA